MRCTIVPRKIRLSPAVRNRIERRLHFALARFDGTIRNVEISLSDENGPRGGVDKRCRVLMTLTRGNRLVVEGRGERLQDLLDRTLERAGRAAARALERRNDRSGRQGILSRGMIRLNNEQEEE
jgi:putative sigma-54 modulation protein